MSRRGRRYFAPAIRLVKSCVKEQIEVVHKVFTRSTAAFAVTRNDHQHLPKVGAHNCILVARKLSDLLNSVDQRISHLFTSVPSRNTTDCCAAAFAEKVDAATVDSNAIDVRCCIAGVKSFAMIPKVIDHAYLGFAVPSTIDNQVGASLAAAFHLCIQRG